MSQVLAHLRRSGGSHRASWRGFTLIELLVVVAIIALLISILLPSLNRARQAARSIGCASLLRSMGQASHMYADANREIHVVGWARAGFDQYIWYRNEAFRSNLGLTGTFWEAPVDFLCPEAPAEERGLGAASDHEQTRATDPYPAHWDHVYGANIIHYRWHGETFDASRQGSGIFNPGAFVHRGSVTRASDKPQFADALMWEFSVIPDNLDPVNGNGWAISGDMSFPRAQTAGIGGGWGTAYRHMGEEGLNALHYDSSVRYMTKEEAFDPDDFSRVMRKWIAYPDPETGEPVEAR